MSPLRTTAKLLGAVPLAALLALGAAGCGHQCDRNPDAPPIRFTGGTTSGSVYESSPWSGEYLDFPPGRTYRFVHGLGGVPRTISFYFAFAADPVDPPDAEDGDNHGGTVAAAGNWATIEGVNATWFDVRNDTCSTVSLRVVASDPVLASVDRGDAAVTGGNASDAAGTGATDAGSTQ